MLTLLIGITSILSAESLYQVGPGDLLMVSLPMTGHLNDLNKISGNALPIEIISGAVYWRHEVVVAPDGRVSLPTLEPLEVSGLTLPEIQTRIGHAFHTSSSRLSVQLLKPVSHGYFVWGEVKNPGRYVYERPTSILEAIGTAGGATDRARLTHVMLMRPGETPKRLDLSTRNFESGSLPNLHLQPNDTVLVPKKRTPDSNTVFLFISAIAAVTGIYAATK